MKKVLLVFLAVLLIATFILAVYFHTENQELREQGKVRVFSLSSWLSSFSHFSVSELSLADIWTRNFYEFKYLAGTEISAEAFESIYDSFLPAGNSASWDSMTISADDIANDTVVYGRLYDIPDYPYPDSVFIESVPGTGHYKAEYRVYVCSWIADKDLSVKVDLTDCSNIESFFIRLKDSFSLVWSYISSIFHTVSSSMPWKHFEVIDIPNQNFFGGGA